MSLSHDVTAVSVEVLVAGFRSSFYDFIPWVPTTVHVPTISKANPWEHALALSRYPPMICSQQELFSDNPTVYTNSCSLSSKELTADRTKHLRLPSSDGRIREPGPVPKRRFQLPLQSNAAVMTAEQLYLAYFTRQMLNMFPESVRGVASRITGLPGLREAVIALSAARLAYIESESRLSPTTTAFLGRPRLQYFVEALSRFNSAVQQIRAHTTDVENDVLMMPQYGRTLLRAGIFLRIRTLFLLGPFSSLGAEPTTAGYLQGLVHEIAEPQEAMYINMTRAVSTARRHILLHCMKTWHIVANKVYNRFQDVFIRSARTPILPSTTEGSEDVYMTLKELRKRNHVVFLDSGFEPLDAMLSNPAEESKSHQPGHSLDIPKIDPVLFDRCEDAIFCAVYAVAQVYCDGELLESLLYQDQSELGAHVVHYLGADPASLALADPGGRGLPQGQVSSASTACERYARGRIGSLQSFSRIVDALDTETRRDRKIYILQTEYTECTEREHFFLMNQVEGHAIHGRDSEGHFFDDYIPT
ncbi:uncharacterized protein BDW43DRAFT_309817 [Aspergillus alliaceus]|uniref:uncharacterized protein n=1 Tax=Petromyces alliaceus TaxID=209559 RepID=UPI0012A4A525|nr:uncharacterized protein BDW43DRAFT_309817 [Aspergillus alliaceus]KAB8234988.1 hypothetical protein BDW43DRAFT_309817 [Aspergillus alliaceus]